MVVGKDDGLSDNYSVLSVQSSPGKKPLAEAIIAKVKANYRQRSPFYGQFNSTLWLALLSGGIKPSQFFWHIWEADLCELSSGLRYKLLYLLCRLAQKRVGYVPATRGDLSFSAKMYPKVWGELLYFPTRMDPSLNTMANDR